jgi:translocation and assembly module TamB
MELAGNLEVVKDSSDLRLFGSVQTLRGQMTLLGRRFDITKGNLTFNGNPKPNPDLSITAENEFLGPNRQKQTLKLELSGNLEQPAFAFLLDNRSITESEAVSYMIFGAAPGDMTSSRQSGVDDVIAMDLASSIASQQLSKTVGEQFDLDYIEVYAADSWQKASFVAGKYLTDRWFLSYKREFSKEQKQETTPVKLTAEYELSRKVSFRFISGNCKERGVDLLIRFERD